MIATNVPLRNDAVAKRILAVIATTKSKDLGKAIEAELDSAYKSRRARSASRNGEAVARIGDRSTSHMAAKTVNVTKLESVVLKALQNARGEALTTYDIEKRSKRRYGSITPRMLPLQNKGLVMAIGTENSSGRPRTLYQLTAKGQAHSAAA